MSTAQFTTPLITVVPGQIISASLWNNEFGNLSTNLNPQGLGAYSDTDPQMQTVTDPFPSGTSRPTSLAGELERLRFQLVEVIGGTYWYNRPADTISSINSRIVALVARFPIQTADIGDSQVTTAKIGDSQVTTAKIADANVTNIKIVSMDANKIIGQIVTSQITDLNVTLQKMAANSVDTGKIVDGSVTAAKLDSGVPAAVGLKSINSYSVNVVISTGSSQTTKDTTITSVNTSKAVAIVTGYSNTAGDLPSVNNTAGFIVSLTSATNLRIVLNMANAEASGHNTTWTFVVTVIEFN